MNIVIMSEWVSVSDVCVCACVYMCDLCVHVCSLSPCVCVYTV